MNGHLSEDQIARCIIGRAANSELLHSLECPECAAELNRFGETVSLFQSAIRDQIDHRMVMQPSAPFRKPAGTGISKQRWALIAAAAFVLIVLPFIRTEKMPEEVEGPLATTVDPSAVMDRVNLQLSRTVPAPLEPLLMGLSNKNP